MTWSEKCNKCKYHIDFITKLQEDCCVFAISDTSGNCPKFKEDIEVEEMNVASEYNIDENSIMACPFCGSTAELRRVGTSAFVVRCKNRACYAEQAATLSPIEAIEAWNRRVYTYPNAI